MPIPNLTEEGLLPEGIHDCTLSELEAAFGNNRWVQDPDTESRRELLRPHRRRLFEWLERYVEGLRRTGLAVYLIIDGSFVTSKPAPNDIDLIVVFPPDHDFGAQLPLQAYDLVSKPRLQQTGYPFDVSVVAEGRDRCERTIAFFRGIRQSSEVKKGLLRVRP